jgi:hypothetical protein
MRFMVNFEFFEKVFKHILTADNHQKCPASYQSWAKDCLPIARRNQMIQRGLMKETVRNYGSQANVDRYTKERESLPTYAEKKDLYLYGPVTN